ncbi:MAG: hypothetical protein KGQ50_00815 [Bacteroidetes bacterium]|nr:hypothetical protein [Bacteroidota bacterium]
MTPLGSVAAGGGACSSLVLNQDLQDYEDFLSFGHWFRWCAQQPGFESGFTGFPGLTITPLV